MSKKKETLWQRLKAKYRVAVINEATLAELGHLRLSLLNLILVFVGITLVTLVLFSLLIWFTPLKNYLPGYNEDIREELVEDNMRIDSLLTLMDAQQTYLHQMHSVIAGELPIDSLPPLDSLYVIRKEELLISRSAVVDSFVAEYERTAGERQTLYGEEVPNDTLSAQQDSVRKGLKHH